MSLQSRLYHRLSSLSSSVCVAPHPLALCWGHCVFTAIFTLWSCLHPPPPPPLPPPQSPLWRSLSPPWVISAFSRILIWCHFSSSPICTKHLWKTSGSIYIYNPSPVSKKSFNCYNQRFAVAVDNNKPCVRFEHVSGALRGWSFARGNYCDSLSPLSEPFLHIMYIE